MIIYEIIREQVSNHIQLCMNINHIQSDTIIYKLYIIICIYVWL